MKQNAECRAKNAEAAGRRGHFMKWLLTIVPERLVGTLALPMTLFFGASGWAETIRVTGSIQETIGIAREGDTVLVSGPGTFRERVVIDKSIALVGANRPAIDGGGTGSVITVQAPNVTIRGLVLRNSGRDLTSYDSGIVLTAPGGRISDCVIDNHGFGIYVRAASECRIEGNEIFGSKDCASARRGNGIHLWKTKDNEIINNDIHDKRDGMYFSFADRNTIERNRVWDTRFGIHYMYSHQNRLLRNVLTRNAVGATLMFSRDSLLEGNIAAGNRRHGMLFKQLDNSRIIRNVVAGQNRGFFVQQAVQNRFEGNLIATNDIGVYLSNCSEQNMFAGNAFVANTDQVWQPPDEVERGRLGSNSFFEKRRGNFWSDYAGADVNRDGIGDTPYHETDVYGYLLDRHPETRVFALSPAVALLRKGEELLPVLDTTGVTDMYPLARRPRFDIDMHNR